MSAPEAPEIVAARARAEAARQRLLTSAHELQARLRPATLAENAKAVVMDKGEALADTASDFARRKPAVVGGVAAAGLAFLARKPILRLFRRKPRSVPAEARSSDKGDPA